MALPKTPIGPNTLLEITLLGRWFRIKIVKENRIQQKFAELLRIPITSLKSKILDRCINQEIDYKIPNRRIKKCAMENFF